MDVKPAQLEIVKTILRDHVAGIEVRAFGSRVLGTSKETSDLDLAVVSRTKLEPRVMGGLKTAFEESDLPFRVDILDWNFISPEFRKLIEDRYEIIQ